MLVGDMNLPGIDWETNTVKPNAQYKSTHLNFTNMLKRNNLFQIIPDPITYMEARLTECVLQTPQW